MKHDELDLYSMMPEAIDFGDWIASLPEGAKVEIRHTHDTGIVLTWAKYKDIIFLVKESVVQ